MKLAEFADKHGLKMKIGERTKTFYCGSDFENAKFYARFEDCDVGEDHVLVGTFGNGATPAKAMEAYAREISGKKLVVGAGTAERREIYAPELLRAMESELRSYRGEDTDLHREISRMQSDHAVALRREEEKGYARGLEDAKKYPETLGLVRATDPTPCSGVKL